MWKSGYMPVSGTSSSVQVSTGGRAGPEEKSLRTPGSLSPGYQSGGLAEKRCMLESEGMRFDPMGRLVSMECLWCWPD